MQISEKMEQYQRGFRETDISPARENTATQKVRPLLEELFPGRVIEGTILQNKNGQVQLGLSNGEILQARLQTDMELVVGQSLFFEVKSNDGNKVQITPYMQGDRPGNPTLLQALEAARLPVTAQNIEMVDAMMQQQMGIDRQSLGQMTRLVMQHPQIPPQTVVEMTKLQIPLTEANAHQFQDYQQGTNQLLAEMEEVQNDLQDILSNETVQKWDFSGKQELISLHQTVAQILYEGTEQMLMQVSEATTDEQQKAEIPEKQVASADIEETKQTAQGGEDKGDTNISTRQSVQKEIQQSTAVKGEETSAQNMDVEKRTEESPRQNVGGSGEENVWPQMERKTDEKGMPLLEITRKESGKVVQQNIEAKNEEGRTYQKEAQIVEEERQINEQQETSGKQPTSSNRTVIGNDAEHMEKTFGQTKNVFVKPKDFMERAQMLEQRLPTLSEKEQIKQVRDFFADLSNALSKEPETVEREWKQLFGSKAYQKLIRQSFELQWTMTPEQVSEKTKISELYQRLQNQLRRLEEVFQTAGKQIEAPKNSVKTIEQNLEFMNQINHIYQYVQLPLKLAGKNAHADLYVYTNKREKKDNEELSAFLHLNLDRLGETDISVRMLQKEVKVQFFLSERSAYELLRSHTDALHTMLQQIGYHGTIQVQEKEPDVDLAENFRKIHRTKKTGHLRRYSFDATV